MSVSFCTYGTTSLSAWKVGSRPGKSVFWLQTTNKRFARKLAKRRDTRCVGVDGKNHFRRTYEMLGDWRKVRRIVDHYLLSASDQNLLINSPVINRESTCGHIIPEIGTTARRSTGDIISPASLALLPCRQAQFQPTQKQLK